ncbi:MAG TPA: histidine phosphatase family protein [Persephonella sp.]|uniref:Phosphoglycerate mutase family protein n=1 Tax=Persephonella marina (strain DSM 14350 / EX-H1) TaxID=123214 RepID=C0QTX1_PERMH|nr:MULTISPECIES: histidine phosphatase family protein [Persephonella]ACO03386.1 phosphoglycerate mutase family protein [Persephonella marina EX-H1]HCB70247.1 histidine phosphatase family protein [Persephonella sp.]
MAVRIIYVRHAESLWNPIGKYQGRLDPELSERGHKQAELLAKILKKYEPSALYSSPLKRTYMTAEYISKELDLPINIDEDIIEIDHGEWSGMLVEEVKEKYPDLFRQWLYEPETIKFPHGETLIDVYNRVKRFQERMLEKHEGETIIAVSHTVPIRASFVAGLDLPLAKFWSFGCDNASYSILDYEKVRPILYKLNNTYFLGDLFIPALDAL